jgi:hypothetical protein
MPAEAGGPLAVDGRMAQLVEEITALNPDAITPLEAQEKLDRWKGLMATAPPKKPAKQIQKEDTPSLFDSL